MIIKKITKAATAITVAILAVPMLASAHVVVTPGEVGVAERQTFNTSVPDEKDIPVTKVRVTIPTQIKSVTPTVKPGWQVEVTKTGTGDNEKATEIIWTGGSIPTGQRDDFTFRAQAPEAEGELIWKAYETYQDGEEVAWDQKPVEGSETVKPYSVTKVVNDLAGSEATPASDTSSTSSDNKSNVALALGALGLIAGASALVLVRRKQS